MSCSTCEVSAHLPCPTFMMTFMARLLQTPPSRFSRPSSVPLEVAGGEDGGGRMKDKEGEDMMEGEEKKKQKTEGKGEER